MLFMTEEEIYKMYKSARYPSKQIGILADLNICTRKEIKDVIKKCEEKAKKEEVHPIESQVVTICPIEERLDELDAIITKATKEYKILADRLINGGYKKWESQVQKA